MPITAVLPYFPTMQTSQAPTVHLWIKVQDQACMVSWQAPVEELPLYRIPFPHKIHPGGVAVSGGAVYNQNYSLVQDQNYTTDQNLSYTNTSLTDLYVNISDPDGPDNTWLTADDGLRPGATSPVREEGNTALTAGNSVDISGSTRVRGCNIDMGAYEADASKLLLHVDAISGSDNNSGNSWSNAFRTLKKALDIANASACVDSILVAKGKYYTSGDQLTGTPGILERQIDFSINRPGIKIYGGFQTGGTGGWTSRELPTEAGTGTILSGDIGANHDSSYNSSHVLLIANVQSASDSIVIDGVGVTEGNASLPFGKTVNGTHVNSLFGGGIDIVQTSIAISIRNSVFYKNLAYNNGGGAAVLGCHPAFINCKFIRNKAAYGGALYRVNSNSVFTNCSFTGNESVTYSTEGLPMEEQVVLYMVWGETESSSIVIL